MTKFANGSSGDSSALVGQKEVRLILRERVPRLSKNWGVLKLALSKVSLALFGDI